MDFAFFSFCNYFNADCSIHISYRHEPIQVSRKTNCLPLTLLFIYFYRVSVPSHLKSSPGIHGPEPVGSRNWVAGPVRYLNNHKGLKHVSKRVEFE